MIKRLSTTQCDQAGGPWVQRALFVCWTVLWFAIYNEALYDDPSGGFPNLGILQRFFGSLTAWRVTLAALVLISAVSMLGLVLGLTAGRRNNALCFARGVAGSIGLMAIAWAFAQVHIKEGRAVASCWLGAWAGHMWLSSMVPAACGEVDK